MVEKKKGMTSVERFRKYYEKLSPEERTERYKKYQGAAKRKLHRYKSLLNEGVEVMCKHKEIGTIVKLIKIDAKKVQYIEKGTKKKQILSLEEFSASYKRVPKKREKAT